MKRDFASMDDIVEGVLITARAPERGLNGNEHHRVYNIGNHKSEGLLHMVNVLDSATGHKARMEMRPLQAGDVLETLADISAIKHDFGFEPKTPISVGIPAFVDWFHNYKPYY